MVAVWPTMAADVAMSRKQLPRLDGQKGDPQRILPHLIAS